MLTDVNRILPPLQQALASYQNLMAFAWRPVICAEELTASIINSLHNEGLLCSLDISTAGLYSQEPSIPISSLANLSRLTLYSPRPYILRSLANSLAALPKPIRSLSLEVCLLSAYRDHISDTRDIREIVEMSLQASSRV